MVTHNVCSRLFSGVRTPKPCQLALIFPSSITDVSAVIYELRKEGGRGKEKVGDLAGGGLGPHS